MLTTRYGRGWGWRQGETNDMKADWRERMGALQASRWPFDSVVEEREVELDLLRRLSAFAQRFFCRSRNPSAGRCHSNLAWIENAFPATARVRCSSVKGGKSSKLLPQSTRIVKSGSASPKTGVRRTALSPQAESFRASQARPGAVAFSVRPTFGKTTTVNQYSAIARTTLRNCSKSTGLTMYELHRMSYILRISCSCSEVVKITTGRPLR